MINAQYYRIVDGVEKSEPFLEANKWESEPLLQQSKENLEWLHEDTVNINYCHVQFVCIPLFCIKKKKLRNLGIFPISRSF